MLKKILIALAPVAATAIAGAFAKRRQTHKREQFYSDTATPVRS